MGYVFEQDDASVAKAFRRIAAELAGKAVAQADHALEHAGPPADETVHELRKACKKLRALLRLVRPAFDGSRKENAAIRDAARGLSFLRDAQVAAATLDRLTAGETAPPGGLAALRGGLAARLREAGEPSRARDALAAFRAEMEEIGRRARRWKLDGKGFDALAGGLGASYGAARRAMQAARERPDARRLHEWRMRVKDHWYHARLLSPVWPELVGAHAAAAGELGELLGQHHDIEMLRVAVAAEAPEAEAAAFLAGLAQAREREIVAHSLALGGRLFAEKPKALTRRWGVYWSCWRDTPAAGLDG